MCGKAVFVFGLFLVLMMQRGMAETMVFDFKDPKEISAVSLTIDSRLEPIFGYAKGISGTVQFDPARPKVTVGTIKVAVDSVQFANEGYTATARGFALEGQKYPAIAFILKKVLSVKKSAPNVYKGVVQADFVCKGITLPLTVPVTASFFPGRAAERTNGQFEGDILVLRTEFSVSRTKLGISRGIPADMVADAVEVRVSCVGIHYAPKPAAAKATAATRTWKVEVEQRDDPVKGDVAVDLDSRTPTLSFQTAEGRLDAEDVRREGKRLMFRLPDNPQAGARNGEAVFDGDTLRGRLVGKNDTLNFHGRPKHASDDVLKCIPPGTVQGPGFRDLKILADGAVWTLADRMKFYHVPAVSLARIENSAVAEVGAFGAGNVETGEPVDENTRFQAGGMGSPLVNLLALRLAALGELDLDRDVNASLRGAKLPDNAFTKNRKVKVLDLLNGTSGLTQYKFTGYRPGEIRPTLAALLGGADPAEMDPLQVKSEPGTAFLGAGVNQAVLEQVIVDTLGRPFAALMRENVFQPLGMVNSSYEELPSGNVALGHYSTGELMLDKVHVYPEQGETGLWTTAGDFARMLCQVQLLLAGKTNAILPPDHLGLLKRVVGPQWVLGLIKSDTTGYLYHGGDSYGYYANHMTHLQNGYGVVVMQNRVMSWRLSNEIIEAVGKQHGMARMFSWSKQ